MIKQKHKIRYLRRHIYETRTIIMNVMDPGSEFCSVWQIFTFSLSILRITNKRSIVLLNPFQCGYLIHICVAAFVFFRMLATKRRKCKKVKPAQTVIDTYQYLALFRKRRS